MNKHVIYYHIHIFAAESKISGASVRENKESMQNGTQLEKKGIEFQNQNFWNSNTRETREEPSCALLLCFDLLRNFIGTWYTTLHLSSLINYIYSY